MKLLIIIAVIAVIVILLARKSSGKDASAEAEKFTTYKYVEGKGVVKIEGRDPDDNVVIYRTPEGGILRMSKNDVINHIKNLGHFARLSGDQTSVAYIMNLNSSIFHLDDSTFMNALTKADKINMFSIAGSDRETPMRLLIHCIYAAGLAANGKLSSNAMRDIYHIGLSWNYSTSDINEIIESLK